MLVIGLMSGTSLDGIDAALCDIRGTRPRVRPLGFRTWPYGASLRRRLLAASEGAPNSAADFARLDVEVGERLARAAAALCRALGVRLQRVRLIGSHGQTVHHASAAATTWQMGDPSVIAMRTGATTIGRFRSADMAGGGEGAPLAPFAHHVLFAHSQRSRAVQNFGGIGNVTLLPASSGMNRVRAFDTGPGNMVIDGLVRHFSRGRVWMDRDGRLARHGRVDVVLLRELLRHPFLRRRPPKSAGREEFGAPLVARIVAAGRRRRLRPVDLIATATAFTAHATAAAYRRFLPSVDEVVVAGGGSRNPVLVTSLAALLPSLRVTTSAQLGYDPDALEAYAFAVLAWAAATGRAAALRHVTGARVTSIAGQIVPGRHYRGLRLD